MKLQSLVFHPQTVLVSAHKLRSLASSVSAHTPSCTSHSSYICCSSQSTSSQIITAGIVLLSLCDIKCPFYLSINKKPSPIALSVPLRDPSLKLPHCSNTLSPDLEQNLPFSVQIILHEFIFPDWLWYLQEICSYPFFSLYHQTKL